MKLCPKCNQTYSDENLNFCLNDGEMLMQSSSPVQSSPLDDPPPTVMMNEARVTNPSNWPQSPPPATWQPPQPVYQQPIGYGGVSMALPPSQALATASLCLGIASVSIGLCCYLGVLLSPAALVTGFIALSQIKSDPSRTGGRGLAIGGIATGIAYWVILILIFIFYGAMFAIGGLK